MPARCPGSTLSWKSTSCQSGAPVAAASPGSDPSFPPPRVRHRRDRRDARLEQQTSLERERFDGRAELVLSHADLRLLARDLVALPPPCRGEQAAQRIVTGRVDDPGGKAFESGLRSRPCLRRVERRAQQHQRPDMRLPGGNHRLAFGVNRGVGAFALAGGLVEVGLAQLLDLLALAVPGTGPTEFRVALA